MAKDPPRRGDEEFRRVRPLPDVGDDDPSDFTPITNFAEMGPALSEIRHAVRDIKPKVDKLVERNVDHEARIKASEARLRRVEDKVADVAEKPISHDCAQVETIREIKEESKKIRADNGDVTQRLTKTETKLAGLGESVATAQADTKAGRRWLIGIIVTLIIVVGGAAFGWVITLVMVRSDVAHLTSRQEEMGERLDTVQATTTKAAQAGVRVEQATKRIETVVQESAPSEPVVALDDVWCALSIPEREKLRRALPSDRIPARRCP